MWGIIHFLREFHIFRWRAKSKTKDHTLSLNIENQLVALCDSGPWIELHITSPMIGLQRRPKFQITFQIYQMSQMMIAQYGKLRSLRMCGLVQTFCWSHPGPKNNMHGYVWQSTKTLACYGTKGCHTWNLAHQAQRVWWGSACLTQMTISISSENMVWLLFCAHSVWCASASLCQGFVEKAVPKYAPSNPHREGQGHGFCAINLAHQFSTNPLQKFAQARPWLSISLRIQNTASDMMS